jgi:hypothetical protein
MADGTIPAASSAPARGLQNVSRRAPRPYVHRPISGLLGRLREAIAADPGKGTDHYAHAVHAPRIETGIALRKLVKCGMAIRAGERNAATFTPGREAIDNRKTPEQRAEANRRRCQRYKAKRRERYAQKVAELQPLRDMLRERKRLEREEQRALKALVRKHTTPAKPDPQAKQREANDRAWVKAQLAMAEAAAPRMSREPETVEQFMARGGRVQTLPGFVHQPDLRRCARIQRVHGGAA